MKLCAATREIDDNNSVDKTTKMVDTQHFCLRWNNYQSSITSAFENLRDDEDFVDVTLACDGRSIKAHRVVLSACSPYFRELLKSTPCKHPVIVLQDVSFPDLHALVEFIYHGEVNVHQRSLSSFLKTAEVLRVSGLTQQQAEETHSQLAQIQSLAANSGARTPISHHNFSEKLHEDPIFARATSPPPHLNSLHSPHSNAASVNQLLRRAAAAAALRRDRNNSTQSDELSLKRHRPDNGMMLNNNNSPDVNNQLPQVTAADFSTIKHNNNNTPPLKDEKNEKIEGNLAKFQLSYGISKNLRHTGNCQTGNGNGIPIREKESLTPSPPSRVQDDVKSEPMELVCSNNNPPSDEHSNDSTGENDANRSSSGGDGKGSLSSANDEEMDGSIHSHPPPPFLMSPAESKLFSTPGSFNFSMAALADPAALAGFNSQLQSAAEMAVSPQGPQNAVVSATPTSSSTNSTSSSSSITSPTLSASGQLLNNGQQQQHQQQQQQQQLTTNSGNMPSNHHPLRMPPPTSGGINEPQECPYCRRTFSCYYSLKRHFQDKHEQSDTLYVCEFCHRRYRTKNSLTTHKSLQHRGSSGMLKRLLKTSAIKNVLGPHHPITHQRPHLFDFTTELGQPPPGIQ